MKEYWINEYEDRITGDRTFGLKSFTLFKSKLLATYISINRKLVGRWHVRLK